MNFGKTEVEKIDEMDTLLESSDEDKETKVDAVRSEMVDEIDALLESSDIEMMQSTNKVIKA